jgi:DNA polymerase-1
VFEKFGVSPDKVVEVQALCGDSVDNVPGAPGIGVKTAAQLINEYGDLETLLARAGEIKQEKRRETLINFADQIRLSRQLVQLDCDTPCPSRSRTLAVRDPDGPTLAAFLEQDGVPQPGPPGRGRQAGRQRHGLPPDAEDGRAQGPAPNGGFSAGRAGRDRAGRAGADSTPRLHLRPTTWKTLDAWIARATGTGSSASTPRPTPWAPPTPACAACPWPSARATPATSR